MAAAIVGLVIHDVEVAVERLRAGGVVAVPTETVYGLAADAENPAAVARIFEIKGRPAGHPLIVHLADADQLDDWARSVPHRRHASSPPRAGPGRSPCSWNAADACSTSSPAGGRRSGSASRRTR